MVFFMVISKFNKLNLFYKNLILVILVFSIGFLSYFADLHFAELILFYALMAIISLSWTSYVSDIYKKIVFGFCTFISVIVSTSIFEANDLIVASMSILAQLLFLLYISMMKED